jgi:hypothetical protein
VLGAHVGLSWLSWVGFGSWCVTEFGAGCVGGFVVEVDVCGVHLWWVRWHEGVAGVSLG